MRFDWKFIVRRVSYAAQRKWMTGGSGRISEVVMKRIETVLCLNCMCCLYTPARYKLLLYQWGLTRGIGVGINKSNTAYHIAMVS